MAEDSDKQQEGSPETRLKQHLAAAVMKIEWTYAIYWSTSISQGGVLSWGDGYYNGDIKTRKTTQAMELEDVETGQRRSEQLRELYQYLSAGDGDQQTTRPSALLSPEDLTNTEWYYLVCMSFTFTSGKWQCLSSSLLFANEEVNQTLRRTSPLENPSSSRDVLPGKAFLNNRHIWLSNADVAETDIFSRSLLAKSASIQTVVCFPFEDGVLELGTSELVSEDPAMVQQLTDFLLEMPIPICTEQTFSPLMAKWDEDSLYSHIGHHIPSNSSLDRKDPLCHAPLESNEHPALPVILHFHAPQKDHQIHDEAQDRRVTESEELDTLPCDCSNECSPDQNEKDSFMIGESNHELEIEMIDGDISSGLQDNTSISFVIAKRVIKRDDSHYIKTLATILRSSQQLPPFPCFPKASHKSCFTVWKRDLSFPERSLSNNSQKLLKTMLMKATLTCGMRSLKAPGENGEHKKAWKPGHDLSVCHVFSERRRDKLSEKFSILRKLVPSMSMVDKASILGDTIEYLRELERRVEELESCREFVELNGKREHPDISERTSDNYVKKIIINGRRCPARKRKAYDITGEADAEHRWILAGEGHPADVNVTVMEEEVLILVRCPWRDCLVLDIVESISSLHLDPFSVQSSTTDGVVSLTIKSKFRNSVASPGMIKRSLQRVVGYC